MARESGKVYLRNVFLEAMAGRRDAWVAEGRRTEGSP